MNCSNVYINASSLKLSGNEGHFGGNAHFFCKLFTNISVTLNAGKVSRGADALVTIDQDIPVIDKDSCSHRSLHFWNHH